MRLQSENRRTSQASLAIDISRSGLPVIGGPPSSKRASFTPLTGTGATRSAGHKRMSSLSDSILGHDVAQVLTLPDLGQQTSSSRRHSGLLRGSPPKLELIQDSVYAEIYALRSELSSVKQELEETRHELCDANEGREASETCVKALREFIADNNMGGPQPHPHVDPTTPTTTTGEDTESKKNGIGWAFKLWKVDSSTKTFPNNTATVAPLSKKLGDFFSSRTSSSGNSSYFSMPSSAQGTRYPGSDNSSVEDSVTEPNSPEGCEGPETNVIVRDGVSSTPEPPGSPDLIKDMPNRVTEVDSSSSSP